MTDEVSKLRSKVVETLSKTIQPSLKDVKSSFCCKIGSKSLQAGLIARNSSSKENEIYRN
jgi:hypothetical protein